MLLVGYVVLGILVFSKDRISTVRGGLRLAVLAIYGFIYSAARAHHPLGPWPLCDGVAELSR